MINKISYKIINPPLSKRFALIVKAIFIVVIFFCSSKGFTQSGTITISNNATSSGTWTYASSNYTFKPNSSSDAVLNVSEITDRLLGGNGITAGNVIIGSTSASNITISDAIVFVNTSTLTKALTFSSGANITVNAEINTSNSNGAGGGITFTTTGGFVLLDQAANLNSSGTSTGGNISFSVTNGLSIASNITSTASSATNNGSVTVTIASSSAFTPFDGQITGVIEAGAFTKNGAGTLMLSGTNIYTGLTTVSAGVLNIQNASALGTSDGATSVTSGAALEIQGGINVTSDSLTLNGTGISNTGALRGISGNNIWGGAISLASASEIAVDASSLTINGIISGFNSGAFNLSKDGAGVLVLGATNIYKGTTTIAAGTIKLSTGTNIPDASGLIFTSANATLDLNGVSETLYYISSSSSGSHGIITNTNASTSPILLTINYTVTGTTITSYANIDGGAAILSLTKNGAGTQTLRGSSTYKGITNVNQGILYIRDPKALGTTDAGTVVADGASLQLNNVLVVGEALTIYGDGLSSAGALSNISAASGWSGNIVLASNASIGSTSTLTIDGVISGGFTLTKVGLGGVVELSGANTFTGIATISAGTLSVFDNAALGTANSTIVNTVAALQLNGVSISGKTLTLNGSGVSSGGALINATSTSTWSGNITLASASTISTSAALTLSGVISGGYSLTKIGTSTLNLTNSNNYSGATTVSAGILNVTAPNSLGTTSSITVSGTTGQLQIAGGNDFNIPLIISSTVSTGALRSMTGSNTWSGIITLQNTTGIGVETSSVLKTSGIISGSFAVTKYGGGELDFNAINTYTGATTVSAGVLKLLAATTIPITNAVVVNATLDLNGLSTTFASLAGTNNNGIITSTKSGTIVLIISGTISTSYTGIIEKGTATSLSLVKAGNSILTLSGANTYDGITNIDEGAINVQDNNALGNTSSGTIVANGAALQIQGSTSIGAEAITISGTGISNTGAIRNMSSSNSIAGTITLATNASIISDASTSLTIGAISGTYSLTIGGTGSVTNGGVINLGSGTLTKIGSGTVNLNAVNVYAGLTTVSAGILKLGASLAIPIINEVTIASGASIDLAGKATTLAIINGLGKITNTTNTVIDLTVSGDETNTITFAGVIENGTAGGKIQLIKTGSNTLILTGNNTYTGNTTVTAGVLQLGASNVLSNSTSLFLNGGEFDTNGFTESLNSLNISNNSILRLDSSVVYSLTFVSMGSVTAGKSLIVYGWRGFDLDKAVTKNGFVGNAANVGILFSSNTKVFVKSTGGLQDIVNGGLTQYGQIVVAKAGSTGVKCTITINSILNTIALNSINFYSGIDNTTYPSAQLASKILISQ